MAVAHGLGNAQQVIEAIKSGEKQYHFVEVMTCPGGCIGGGGQPRFTDNEVRQARIAAIYREDEGKKLRKSHENPDVAQALRGVPRQAAGREVAPPAAHPLPHPQLGLTGVYRSACSLLTTQPRSSNKFM